mgnify:CR=1 FL=1
MNDQQRISTRRLHVGRLVIEASRSSKARPVAGIVVLVLTSAMCFLSIATVGRSLAAERDVGSELEGAGARELVVANSGAWDILGPDVIALVGSMEGVERAVGVGAPIDVSNSAIDHGERAPAWALSGDVADVIEIVEGRAPLAGEAVVSVNAQHRLGFVVPVGAVVTRETNGDIPVVGSYRARAPFEDLDGIVVFEPSQEARQLRVVLSDITSASAVQEAVLDLVDPSASSDVSVTSPVTIAQLHENIIGTLGRYGAGLLAMVLGMGALLVAAVVTADTAMSSAEWGRRRALGASRGQLVMLAALRVMIGAVAGAVVGVGIAVAVARSGRWDVDWLFTSAVAVLTVNVAVVATLPPAIRAAWRDPVSVLRTP